MHKIKNLLAKYNNFPIQVKASVWFLICNFLQKGISFITTPIFTRIMTPEEYGAYSVFISWHGIVSVVVTLNLFAGVYLRGLVKYEEERPQFISSFQGLSFTLMVIWTGIYVVFKDYINEVTGLTTVQMLCMLVLIWLTNIFGFWSAEQRVDFKYRALVILTLVVSIANTGLGIVFVYFAEDKVTARILGAVLVELIAYFGLFVSQLKKGRQFFNKKFWKYALKFNIPLIPHYLSTTVLNSADRIMIGDIVGDFEAGIYNLAYQVAMIMMLFNNAMTQTIEPWLYKKINKKEIDTIANVAYPTFIVIALLNVLLIALAPEAVTIFAPEEYKDAIYIIPPVAMSGFFMFLYFFFAVFEFYYSKTKFVAGATMVGAILNIVLNYIFIDMFGYMAAGYTTLVCYIIYAVCHYLGMNKACKDNLNNVRPYKTKILLLISFVFMGIGFVLLFTYNYPIIRYVLLFVIIIVAIIMRKKIICFAKELLNLRKKED